jgi:hypothetical protein
MPPLANVAISNVPGPQFPLYFAGAKLAHFFPVSIPGHGIALNITVQSYNGLLEVGLTACRRALPDVADLGNYIVDEHKKLLAMIAAQEPAALPAAAVADVAKAPAKPTNATSATVVAKKVVARKRPAAPRRTAAPKAVPAAVAPLAVAPAARKPARKRAASVAKAA